MRSRETVVCRPLLRRVHVLELPQQQQVVHDLCAAGDDQRPAEGAVVKHPPGGYRRQCSGQSAGLPVLSFRCDFGPEEMIEDGVDGVLVEPERIDDLSQKLSDLMKNEKLRMMLGTAACKSAARYEVTQIVSKWEAIVKKEICSNGK